MLPLFGTTLLLSATLIFTVQPLIARLILPRLGGAPAVWNTCLVFFQVALLAGYFYADASVRRLGVRRQILVHLAVLLVPLAFLPIAVSDRWVPPASSNPAGWVLLLLTLTVGPPFIVASASAPLLQRWFGATTHAAARDPYFLYAVSNFGSLGALLAYPLVIEPNLTLVAQSRLWAAGYVALIVLIALCGWRAERTLAPDTAPSASHSGLSGSVRWPVRLQWLALAFVPASLLVGVTTYISTDVASVPLLWVLPLALYLLTFVLVFARRPPLPHTWMTRLLPVAVAGPLLSVLNGLTRPLAVYIPLHLFGFFVAVMVCHGELARRRPPAEHLTTYYLWMSIGGALGGLFGALAAPFLFPTGIGEYQLGLVLACALRPKLDSARDTAKVESRGPTNLVRERWADLVVPVLFGVGTWGAALLLRVAGFPAAGFLVYGVVFGVPLLASLAFWPWPLRSALSVGAILLAASIYTDRIDGLLHAERNFFGTQRVREVGPSHVLMHGTTYHGAQSMTTRCQPLTYYHRTGPIGDLFRAIPGRERPLSVGVVGLGAGAMATYAKPGERWTFYEIDPAILRTAQDARYFTLLRDCAPGGYRVVLGDARLSLGGAPNGMYDLLFIDAFSSDAMPVHLITREALRLYFAKLSPDGVLVINISSRYFNLRPVLAALARDLGLVALGRHDSDVPLEAQLDGRFSSSWVVMARRAEDLGTLGSQPGWERLDDSGRRAWTDDFSDIVSALKW